MKKIFFLILFLADICPVFAHKVDIEKAKKVAKNFIDNRFPNRINHIGKIIKVKYKEEGIVYYFVNFREGGWIIVSADDNTIPILGFSFEGNIDENYPKPSSFKEWVDNYKKQIIKTKTLTITNKEIKDKWNKLLNFTRLNNLYDYIPGTKLLHTPDRGEILWAQDINNSNGCTPSYNKFCPSSNNSTCDCNHKPVGCGAVALGQIMWYWQWPNNSTYRSYDWDLMPNELLNSSTSDEGDEIAHLLKDIGNASNMTYWCAGSWTTMNRLVFALKNKFNYKGIEKKIRNNWPYGNAWNDLIRAEIDAGRPVVYRGDKSDLSPEKHIFIIDGYSTYDINFFHINWGWAGYLNGYFYFDDLTPGNNNFNKNQRAIIGISPTCSESPYNINSVSYTHVTSFIHEQARNNISLPANGENISVEKDGKLIFTAGNSDILNPGFSVKANGKFKAKIREISDGQMGISVAQWTSIFTPNGDGINDELCFNVNNANSWEFQSFNASSNQLVFQSAGIVSNNTACVWDGTGSCDQCTYLVNIKFRNSCGEVLENTYNVMVLVGSNIDKLSNTETLNKLNTKTIKNTNNYLDSIIDDNQSIVNLSEPIINVFPNPNNGSFFLSLQNIVSYVDIICTDRFGKVMYEKKNLKLDNQKINLKQVTTGIYYLHVITKHKIFVYIT